MKINKKNKNNDINFYKSELTKTSFYNRNK